MARTKTAEFTLDMAAGRTAITVPVKWPDGRTVRFRFQQPSDVQRLRLMDRIQAAQGQGDAALVNLLADLLVTRSTDDSSREDIHAMLSHPDTTEDAISQLLTLVLTARVPDPKLHGLLLDKLTDRMFGDLISRL